MLDVVDDPDNVNSLSTAIYMSTTVGYGMELSVEIFDGQVRSLAQLWKNICF